MTLVKPLFYLVRPGLERLTPAGTLIVEPGAMVPLIPMDMLPDWLEVVGVPRQLDPEQASHMVNTGAFHAETDTYRLKVHVPPDEEEDAEASDCASADSTRGHSSSSSTAGTGRSKDPAPARRANWPPLPPGYMVPDTTTTTAPGTAPGPAGTKTPHPCRRWCNDGTCRYGLSCRFEHSMPTTAEGLRSVGLCDFPDWWLASIGVAPMPAGLCSPGLCCDVSTAESRKASAAAEKSSSYRRRRQKRATATAEKVKEREKVARHKTRGNDEDEGDDLMEAPKEDTEDDLIEM